MSSHPSAAGCAASRPSGSPGTDCVLLLCIAFETVGLVSAVMHACRAATIVPTSVACPEFGMEPHCINFFPLCLGKFYPARRTASVNLQNLEHKCQGDVCVFHWHICRQDLHTSEKCCGLELVDVEHSHLCLVPVQKNPERVISSQRLCTGPERKCGHFVLIVYNNHRPWCKQISVA